jgi:hypothetical protein
MWSAIRWLVLRIIAARWLFKLSGLGLLVPIALLLKAIGLPLLGVLSVLAFPILILLFLFGLPLFLVLAVGGLFMGLLATVLMIGVAALKIGLFIVLPVWLIWKLAAKLFRRGSCRDNGDTGTTGTTGTTSSPNDRSTGPTPSDPLNGADPA